MKSWLKSWPARALALPLDPRRVASSPGPADAIVVLGAPLRGDGTLSRLAEERVRVAVELYRRGLAPVVCVAGGHCPPGFEHTLAEAEGAARWLRAAGVPDSALRVDRESASTRENAARAAALLLPEGRRRVWLVTQPFHLRRALYYFRRAGFEPLGFLIEDGLQDRDPRAGVRWMVREYGAWALALARGARGRLPW
ncbi:MAG TPA: YdcF family protein [Kofleriaceae bacterium]|nr:YdcF family protein [Kofleriaceae bacterium]